MSTIKNSSSHLIAGAHPSNNRYCLHSAKDTSVVSTVSTSAMGGMVSAISAVLCGTRRNPEANDLEENDTAPITKSANRYYDTYGDRDTSTGENGLITSCTTKDTQRLEPDFTALDTQVSRESSYQTPNESDSEFVDTVELMDSPRNVRQHFDFPYIDEDSGRSQLSISTTSVNTPGEKRVTGVTNDVCSPSNIVTCHGSNKQNTGQGGLEEVVVISEDEYSADEEQEEMESELSDVDEMARVNSETEGESEDEHVCNSECEHSEYEIEDESEVGSEEEEHICDSDCDHSDVESYVESEYESEEVVDSDADDGDQEDIEISENEHSCDEEQQTDGEELEECECDSNCPSDCDGNHHECSSECGCDQYQSDSDIEHVNGISDNDNDENEEEILQNGTHNHRLPLTKNGNANKLEILNKIANQSTTSLKSAEKNNNRVHRHHSHRLPLRNDDDMLGELRTAIDARVRRSVSCRETSSDHRKHHSNLSNEDNGIAEHFNKLDTKDRELRRKERRTRLRTLELKREQCLDEVRHGTEENVTGRVYREASKVET